MNEPCLCGDLACSRCFPGSYRNEKQWEWIANYFPGKRCESCQYKSEPNTPGVDTGCGVLDKEDELDDCPALAAEDRRAEDDAAYSKRESGELL